VILLPTPVGLSRMFFDSQTSPSGNDSSGRGNEDFRFGNLHAYPTHDQSQEPEVPHAK